jgi:hypothetical protein
MKTHKVIKSEKGRVTIQTNSFGINEIKVRVGESTHIIKCHYVNLNDIEKMVQILLSFKN